MADMLCVHCEATLHTITDDDWFDDDGNYDGEDGHAHSVYPLG